MAGKKEIKLGPTEEQPYEIPENWCWVYGTTIFGKMLSKKPTGETFRYIDIDSIDNQHQRVTEPKVTVTEEAPSRASRHLQYGDTVFSLVRPYLKNIAVIDETLSDCIGSTGFYVCRPHKAINPLYIYRLMT
ncbi:MAG: restriction endonuclease subunit S, partial [Clostridia bacterium]|nr:restriction endonuclease subunit S [Clostridia bacterium]